MTDAGPDVRRLPAGRRRCQTGNDVPGFQRTVAFVVPHVVCPTPTQACGLLALDLNPRSGGWGHWRPGVREPQLLCPNTRCPKATDLQSPLTVT